MKVIDVSTYTVDSGASKNWIFVKVQTDEGIYGWGEAYTQVDRDESIEAHIQAISGYLKGRSPFNIKHFTQVMHLDYVLRRPSMEFYCALAAIEQALWDIIGKKLNQPVYNLLGGACRDKVRVYANGWYAGAKTPEQYGQKALETVQQGFTALKFDPFPGPWRDRMTLKEEDLTVETVRAIREAVGPDIDLLIEVHRRLEPQVAVKMAKRLEPFNLFWYEEPVDVENLDALTEVRNSIQTPVVTGETLYSKTQFKEVFAKRAAQIINPDVCSTGILELKEIAAMAEAHRVSVSPHNYNSTTVGLGATLQVAACIPNFLITEFFVHFQPRSNEIMKSPFQVKDGYIHLPQSPGLGVELDEEMMRQFPRRQFSVRPIRQFYQEDQDSLVVHDTSYLK
jgi:galactonate dehydratase